MKTLLAILTMLTALNTAGVLYLAMRDTDRSVAVPSRSDHRDIDRDLEPSIPFGRDDGDTTEVAIPFYERPLDEKISQATVIFTVRYEPQGDQMRGIVDRVLKKEDGVEFYYEEGDHYASADFTPKVGEVRGEGMVNLCLGNPASMSSGSSIHQGRIPGLGGIKLEELTELVEKAK